MKKYVIGIIAIMASLTVGCSDDSSEQLMDEPSRKPMTFAINKEALTRLGYFDYINDANQLWSFTVVAQVDGEIYHQGNFIYDQMLDSFKPQNEGDIWLWPGIDSQEVTFYATNDQGWFRNDGVDEPIVGDEYTFANEMGTHDLICAYTKISRADCQNGVVELKFDHALAEFGILLRGEFPVETITSYRIISIDVSGEHDQSYNFSSENWSEVGGRTISDTYFDTEDGSNNFFELGDTNGTFVEPLTDPQQQREGDTFRFLQPGSYKISIHYWQENEEKFREATVELKRGKKNRIQMHLPYEQPA